MRMGFINGPGHEVCGLNMHCRDLRCFLIPLPWEAYSCLLISVSILFFVDTLFLSCSCTIYHIYYWFLGTFMYFVTLFCSFMSVTFISTIDASPQPRIQPHTLFQTPGLLHQVSEAHNNRKPNVENRNHVD